MSLNGSELLSDAGQTLSSCGIVSGDLISVILPESVAAGADHAENQREEQNQQNAAMASNQVRGSIWSRCAVVEKQQHGCVSELH